MVSTSCSDGFDDVVIMERDDDDDDDQTLANLSLLCSGWVDDAVVVSIEDAWSTPFFFFSISSVVVLVELLHSEQ